MRKLLLLLLIVVSPAYAQTWQTLNVDLIFNMNTSTPGTTLTPTIAAAGMVSNTCTITTNVTGVPNGCAYQTIPSGITVGANQNACSNLGPVQMNNGGSLFAAQSLNYNNVAMADNVAFGNQGLFQFGSGISPSNMTIAGCFTLGMPGALDNNLYDMVWMQDINGNGPILQMSDGCNGTAGQFTVHIEAVHPTTHSSCIRVIPGQTYWFSLNWNATTGIATLTAYTAQGALLGQVTLNGNGAGNVTQVRLPSNENGTDSGTTYYQNLMMNWTNPPVSLFWNQTDTWAGVLGPSRGEAWSASGVQGGIPTNRTQCGATIAAGATAATINTAISNCGNGQYVLLGPGTFSGLGNINISKSNVTLRGSGADQTILQFTGGAAINLGTNNTNTKASPVLVTPMGCANRSIFGASCNSVGGGAVVQGANTVSLASVSGLVVGNPIVFDQHDSTTDNGGILNLVSDNSYTGPFTSPGTAGPYTVDGAGAQNLRCPGGQDTPASCFSQQHQAFVTSCNGVTTIGTACTSTNVTVGFSPSIYMPNWSTSSAMSAWWYTAPISYSGVEDLQIDMRNNTGSWDNLSITNCANCWEKGVASYNGAGDIGHTVVAYSPNSTIVNNYFFLTQRYITSSYGVVCLGTANLRVENNIFHAIASPIIDNSTCVGMVDDYNYGTNMFYSNPGSPYNQNFRGGHAPNFDELGEGNIANTLDADVIHATSNWNTYFRNIYIGPQPECYNTSSNTTTSSLAYSTATYSPCQNFEQAVFDSSYHRFYNFIGNILGTSGFHNTYIGSSNTSIYQMGIGNAGAPPAIPNEPVPLATAIFWGNADAVTGFGSPRFNCNELMAGTAFISLPLPQISGYEPCPASNNLPASFLYSSKPSWWPSGKPWPPIGPDVTGGNLLVCNSGAQIRSLVTSAAQCPSGTTTTYASGHANSNPAMDCFLNTMGGPGNGVTTGPLAFNESTCFPSTPPPPAPQIYPLSGTYYGPQLTKVIPSSGTVICYNTTGSPATSGNGSTCATGSTLYNPAALPTIGTGLPNGTTQTVFAVSGTNGAIDSAVGSQTYIFMQPHSNYPDNPSASFSYQNGYDTNTAWIAQHFDVPNGGNYSVASSNPCTPSFVLPNPTSPCTTATTYIDAGVQHHYYYNSMLEASYANITPWFNTDGAYMHHVGGDYYFSGTPLQLPCTDFFDHADVANAFNGGSAGPCASAANGFTHINGVLLFNGTSYIDDTICIYTGTCAVANTTIPNNGFLYLGYAWPFDTINIGIATAQSGGTVSYQYCNSASFSPSGGTSSLPTWSPSSGGGQPIYGVCPSRNWTNLTVTDGSNSLGSGGTISGGVLTAAIASGGTGYAVNDTGVICSTSSSCSATVGTSGANATYVVNAVTAGMVTGITITTTSSGIGNNNISTAPLSGSVGSGYTTANGVATTPAAVGLNHIGTGSGLTLNITAFGTVTFTPPSNWSRSVLNGPNISNVCEVSASSAPNAGVQCTSSGYGVNYRTTYPANTTRPKYWVRIAVTGSSTAPVISEVRGDTWSSLANASSTQTTACNTSATGATHGCNYRGWCPPATQSFIDVNEHHKYNPAPTQACTAHFEYQAHYGSGQCSYCSLQSNWDYQDFAVAGGGSSGGTGQIQWAYFNAQKDAVNQNNQPLGVVTGGFFPGPTGLGYLGVMNDDSGFGPQQAGAWFPEHNGVQADIWNTLTDLYPCSNLFVNGTYTPSGSAGTCTTTQFPSSYSYEWGQAAAPPFTNTTGNPWDYNTPTTACTGGNCVGLTQLVGNEMGVRYPGFLYTANGSFENSPNKAPVNYVEQANINYAEWRDLVPCTSAGCHDYSFYDVIRDQAVAGLNPTNTRTAWYYPEAFSSGKYPGPNYALNDPPLPFAPGECTPNPIVSPCSHNITEANRLPMFVLTLHYVMQPGTYANGNDIGMFMLAAGNNTYGGGSDSYAKLAGIAHLTSSLSPINLPGGTTFTIDDGTFGGVIPTTGTPNTTTAGVGALQVNQTGLNNPRYVQFANGATVNGIAMFPARDQMPQCNALANTGTTGCNFTLRICHATDYANHLCAENGESVLVNIPQPPTAGATTATIRQSNAGYSTQSINNSYASGDVVEVFLHGALSWDWPADTFPTSPAVSLPKTDILTGTYEDVYNWQNTFPGQFFDVGKPDTASGWCGIGSGTTCPQATLTNAPTYVSGTHYAYGSEVSFNCAVPSSPTFNCIFVEINGPGTNGTQTPSGTNICNTLPCGTSPTTYWMSLPMWSCNKGNANNASLWANGCSPGDRDMQYLTGTQASSHTTACSPNANNRQCAPVWRRDYLNSTTGKHATMLLRLNSVNDWVDDPETVGPPIDLQNSTNKFVGPYLQLFADGSLGTPLNSCIAGNSATLSNGQSVTCGAQLNGLPATPIPNGNQVLYMTGTTGVVLVQGTPPANPTATLNPNLNFGNQNINTTSAGMAVTFANIGSVPVIVTQSQLFGTNFTLTNLGTCFTTFGSNTSFTLPAGQSCTFVITFTPTQTIAYTGGCPTTNCFSVTSNATGSPQSITLNGQGTAPIITWISTQGGTAYNFGNIIVNTSSDSPAQTLQNTGTGPLNIALTITPSQFVIKSSTCPSPLAAGASCSVVVTFTPNTVSSFSGAVTETDSVQGLTGNLSLSGAGVTPPSQQVAPWPPIILGGRR